MRRDRKRGVRRENMLVEGAGANSWQDRGAAQRIPAAATQNPYYCQSQVKRAQDCLKMFNTCWEARKIVTIPVDDAFKYRAEIKGLKDHDARELWKVYDDLGLDRQNRRGLIQERLFGGCLGFGVFRMDNPSSASLASPLRLEDIRPGDFEALNIVDITQIGLERRDANCFSASYDQPPLYTVNNCPVDRSRLIIMDGEPVAGRHTRSLLEGGRANWLGFSESVLTPLYDIFRMSTGAQEGAYHLINLASCLIVKAEHLRSMKATNSKAAEALEELVRYISIYRGAVMEGKNVEITQHAANFGAVPELMMMYMQFLSAGSDIPATRFLGQAPGGLNATGASDLQNYYNMVRSNIQIRRLRPIQLREFDWIGCSLWGYAAWMDKRRSLELDYPPLWNETAKEKADRMAMYAGSLDSLVKSGVIARQTALKELEAQGFSLTMPEGTADSADEAAE